MERAVPSELRNRVQNPRPGMWTNISTHMCGVRESVGVCHGGRQEGLMGGGGRE